PRSDILHIHTHALLWRPFPSSNLCPLPRLYSTFCGFVFKRVLTHNAYLRAWLFKITHNKAIDHLRKTNLETLEMLDEHFGAEPADQPLEASELTTFALSLFLNLVPRQRSCVILKDVLGYSLAEISELLDATVPEIKATLHRGRARVRELANTVELETFQPNAREQELLSLYVSRFNSRDFDGLRAMLAEEVFVDLVGRTKVHGAHAVAESYFHSYSQASNWRFALGEIEGRPAVLVYDLHEKTIQPSYFILLVWENERVVFIRDYLFARYVLQHL
ncbi:MAG: sigma factor-like helix-turn-helix DNA-binding protein, partial [Aggregatilineales bacterium]